MPRIEPVPMEHLDQELQDLIAAGRATGMLSTTIPNQIWAYRPELSKIMIKRYKILFDDGLLEPRLVELVRLRVAVYNDCTACKAARKSDAVTEEDIACLSSGDERFTPRESLALKFTDLFVTDHMSIDDQMIRDLGALFTKAEIIELMMFVSGAIGGGRMAHVLKAWASDDSPPVLAYEGEFAPKREKVPA